MNEQEQGAIDRLMARRQTLAQHLAAQESELVKTGHQLMALDVTLNRLRKKSAATKERRT